MTLRDVDVCLTLYLIETFLRLLQTEQTQIRQLLSDQGNLCLLLKYDTSDPTQVNLTNKTNMKVYLYNYS